MKPSSIFLFRRDLRLADNTALNEALRQGDAVLPVFIIDPRLLKRWEHSTRRLSFLFQSLALLQAEIRQRGGVLLIATGDAESVLPGLVKEFGAKRIFANRGYSPYGRQQDQLLARLAANMNIGLSLPDDALLNPPPVVLKKDGLPYTVFTPYYRKASTFRVAQPSPWQTGRFVRLPDSDLRQFSGAVPSLDEETGPFEPGERGAASGMAKLAALSDYAELRDVPETGHTSYLSAHLRFGTCSPRQVHAAASEALGEQHPLIRQLYWRDFYHQIGWHFPHVFGHAFRRQYDAIPWQGRSPALELWKAGRTGYPIVDAGMRELSATGYMHNRVRMVTASFLTKNLHIDWRLGEAHFAEQLVDYDPAVNNGNWQWSASTGCDAQPYFRVFNPWRQQKKFDRDCIYVKRWVPELEPWPARAIHKLETEGAFYLPKVVDVKESARRIKKQFKSVSMRS